MTEDDARAWIATHWGGEAAEQLSLFGAMVVEENGAQNLIAPSTTHTIWSRHLADSAQLVSLAPAAPKRWLDVGTGAGFPGMVVAVLCSTTTVTLVEPRRRRVEFLHEAVRHLQLKNVAIEQKKVEAVQAPPFDVITARAVANAGELIHLTSSHRHAGTRYILPRGRSGREEVESLTDRWQGLFHVEQSLTDPESTIIVADGVF